METEKIIIIGSGMAGITLALFLKKAGISAVVYEAYPEYKNAGLAFTIAPNGMNVLNELGLAEKIIASGNIISAYEFRNAEGKHLARMRTGPVEKYGQPPVLIERGILQDLLHKTALEQGIEINYDKKLISVNENPNKVTAWFADGTRTDASLIIAADGIHSTVRNLIFPDAPKPLYVGFYGTGGFVNIKDISGRQKPCKSDMTLVYGYNGFFGYGFKSNDELLWWSSLEVPENEAKSFLANVTDEQIRSRLLALFNGYSHPVKELVTGTKKFAKTISYELDQLSNWHKGRIMLIGDAAHALSTTSGQGASMAFEDAMYLAKLLRDNTVANYEQVFSIFETDRKPRLLKLMKGARRGNSDKKVTNPFKLFIREKLISFFIWLFAEKGLEWQYGYKIKW